MAFASDSLCAEASPKAVKCSSGGSHSPQEGMPQVPKAPLISPDVSGCGKGRMNVLSPYSRCPQLSSALDQWFSVLASWWGVLETTGAATVPPNC